MLALGFKQFYARGLHLLAPRPQMLRMAVLSQQQMQFSLYQTQTVSKTSTPIMAFF